jgi:hypothetical protein
MEEAFVLVDLDQLLIGGFAPCIILQDIERSDDDVLGSWVAELSNAVDADVVNFEAGAVFEGEVPLLVSLFIKVIDELIPCTLQAWVFDFWAVGDFPDPEAFEAGGEVSAFAVSLYFVAGGGAVEVPVLEVEVNDLHGLSNIGFL